MKQRIVHPEMGIKLTEDEFIGIVAYYSGEKEATIWKHWRNGVRFGSIATGEAGQEDVYEE